MANKRSSDSREPQKRIVLIIFLNYCSSQFGFTGVPSNLSSEERQGLMINEMSNIGIMFVI